MENCFVFDLDNTIYHNNTIIVPQEYLLYDNICINTLRSPAGMLKILNVQYMPFPSIHFGGSLIYDTLNSRTLYYNLIDKIDYNNFVAECDNNKIDYRTIYMDKNAISSVYNKYGVEKLSIKEDIEVRHIPKINSDNIEECDVIAIYTEKRVKSKSLNYYKEGRYYIYTSKNSTKGNATLYLKKLYDIKKIYAFGNSKNDYSMLDIADYPYYLKRTKKYNHIKYKDILKILKGVKRNESI